MKWLRRWLLIASIPIQRVIQKLHPPEPKITASFAQYVASRALTGDVFLSRQDWHFSNMFIPGFWSHAAICCDIHIVEALGDGVRAVFVDEWLFKKDYVMVLRLSERVPPVRETDATNAGLFAMGQVGKPYDFLFKSGVKAWYCSELIYWALKKANDRIPFTLRKTWGVNTVTPQDFENAVRSGKFEIIADSRFYL